MLNEKKFKEIYDVERRADQEKLSFEERAALRSRLSCPIMVPFEMWIVKEYPPCASTRLYRKSIEIYLQKNVFTDSV